MQPLLGLTQVVGRAPRDDFFTVIEETLERFFEVEQFRPAIDDGEQVDAEGFLQRGVLVELVDNDFRHRVALELDDDAHSFAIGFVAQVANPFDLFLLYQRGDLFDQLTLFT